MGELEGKYYTIWIWAKVQSGGPGCSSRDDLHLISFNNDFIQTLNTIGAQKLSLLTSKRPLYFYDYQAVASKLAVLYTDLAHRLAVQQSQKKISDEPLRNNFNSLVWKPYLVLQKIWVPEVLCLSIYCVINVFIMLYDWRKYVYIWGL